MDWLTSLTKIVEVTAWPIVSVVFMITFRNRLDDLFERISEIGNDKGKIMFALAQKDVDVNKKVDDLKQELNSEDLPATEREAVANSLEEAVRESERIADAKREVFRAFAPKISTKREEILRAIVAIYGAGELAPLSINQLIAKWPDIAVKVNMANSYYLNGGAILALRSVGILDDEDRLTPTGASFLNLFALEQTGRV